MFLDFLDLLDDMTGNITSDFIDYHDRKQRQRVNNMPSNLIARKKIELFNDIARYKDYLEEYKNTPSLVEIYTKKINEAKEQLEMLR